ncbi:MAG: type I restriction endonuclease subunit R [Bryobacterales bacterium]|nr:type I restriction endonuclease subunit R [Bryobacterales bacterium]
MFLCVEALDEILAKYFEKHRRLLPEAAAAKAEAFTAPRAPSNQEDDKPSEDHYVARVRKLLRRNSLNDQQEKELIKAFKKKGQPPYMLIVCDKLLTGFDAPIESVMYLDKPLKEHNLLQAIARTNRVAPLKQFGLIVDYIGVTRNLDEALASYRREDVANALRDLDELEATLKEAHAEVRVYLDKVRRKNGGRGASG